jgi:hypothetical protein
MSEHRRFTSIIQVRAGVLDIVAEDKSLTALGFKTKQMDAQMDGSLSG